MRKEWLKFRDIDCNGKMYELKMRIIDLKKKKDGPPKVCQLTDCSLEDINHCVGSLLSMIAIVMIREVSVTRTHYNMDREIYIFLSNTNKVDYSIDKNKPT